jgi:hypothetical protein
MTESTARPDDNSWGVRNPLTNIKRAYALAQQRSPANPDNRMDATDDKIFHQGRFGGAGGTGDF